MHYNSKWNQWFLIYNSLYANFKSKMVTMAY